MVSSRIDDEAEAPLFSAVFRRLGRQQILSYMGTRSSKFWIGRGNLGCVAVFAFTRILLGVRVLTNTLIREQRWEVGL